MKVDEQIDITKKYNLRPCSCGRCCNSDIVKVAIEALQNVGHFANEPSVRDFAAKTLSKIKKIGDKNKTRGTNE